jgi:hypothetical protein
VLFKFLRFYTRADTDSHLDIHRESRSTPWLTNIVFSQAERMGYRRHFIDSRRAIDDDHLPLRAYCEVVFNPPGATPAPAIDQFGWVAMAYVCGVIQMRKQHRSTRPQWLGRKPPGQYQSVGASNPAARNLSGPRASVVKVNPTAITGRVGIRAAEPWNGGEG